MGITGASETRRGRGRLEPEEGTGAVGREVLNYLHVNGFKTLHSLKYTLLNRILCGVQTL